MPAKNSAIFNNLNQKIFSEDQTLLKNATSENDVSDYQNFLKLVPPPPIYKGLGDCHDFAFVSEQSSHKSDIKSAYSELPVSLIYTGRTARQCAPTTANVPVPKPKYFGLKSLDFTSGKKVGV